MSTPPRCKPGADGRDDGNSGGHRAVHGAAKRGAAKRGAAKRGAPKRGAAKRGAAKRGAAKRGAAKRMLDVLGAGCLLLGSSPLMAAVALGVRIAMGSPIFFRQERPGLHGHPFTMYKFRTMREARDRNGHPLPDRERLTRLGQFLRATSLDELPELVHVLTGQMSLVGPRPLLMRYMDRYSSEQARRHLVKPGITGWAQIHGRNAVDWDQRLAMDCWYVDHQSIWLDLYILARTPLEVVRRRGIRHPDSATMPEFRGPRSQP